MNDIDNEIIKFKLNNIQPPNTILISIKLFSMLNKEANLYTGVPYTIIYKTINSKNKQNEFLTYSSVHGDNLDIIRTTDIDNFKILNL